MRRIKIALSVSLLAGVVASVATQSVAYPPFLAQAKKFGAKDCRFCHINAEGGVPFNTRGKWLIAEKDRRHADTVDPAWLAGYKKSSKKKK